MLLISHRQLKNIISIAGITFLTIVPIVLRLSSSFQRILGVMEVSCHRLGLNIDRTKKKTRLVIVEIKRKE
jgi:hypothetical protein